MTDSAVPTEGRLTFMGNHVNLRFETAVVEAFRAAGWTVTLDASQGVVPDFIRLFAFGLRAAFRRMARDVQREAATTAEFKALGTLVDAARHPGNYYADGRERPARP